MITKKISLDDISNNPGNKEFIQAFNKQLEKDMENIIDSSARIEDGIKK